MLSLGDSFYAPNKYNSKEHLSIVISKPNPDGKILTVNVTHLYAEDPNQDKSCTLLKGCHPNITKDSVVNYARPFAFDAKKLTTLVDCAIYQAGERFSESQVVEIQKGARISEALPLWAQAYFGYF
jgi:hypothetical protein